MPQVAINNVQLGTARMIRQNGSKTKFEQFKPLPIRASFLGVNWRELGDVDLIYNADKGRITLYPSGSTNLESAIIRADVIHKKMGRDEFRIERTEGTGRYKRMTIELLLRIPDKLPPLVKSAKESTPKTRLKSKKRAKR